MDGRALWFVGLHWRHGLQSSITLFKGSMLLAALALVHCCTPSLCWATNYSGTAKSEPFSLRNCETESDSRVGETQVPLQSGESFLSSSFTCLDNVCESYFAQKLSGKNWIESVQCLYTIAYFSEKVDFASVIQGDPKRL